MNWVAILVALLALATPAAAADDDDDDRDRHPNILVIVSDDQGSWDYSFTGNPRMPTPNIDRLADEGLRLTRFYSEPWCAPTRAAMQTGTSPGTWGYDSPLDFGIPAGTFTIARRFQEAGYRTALVGKWHAGTGPAHPNAMGYEHFYGHLGAVIDYVNHTAGGRLDWQRNGVDVVEEGYSTDLLTDEAVDLIERRDDRPFFLVLSYNAPHGGPNWVTPELAARYCAAPTFPYNCGYFAAVQQMDLGIGRVLDALEREGLEKNTLVVFFSDNGGPFFNLPPLRGTKFLALEGGIRVGALVRWHGKVRRGESDVPMHVRDLWATLEAAAKLDRRAPAEGNDLWREVRGKRRQPRAAPLNPIFSTNRPHPCFRCCCFVGVLPFPGWRRQSAMIDGRWKLLLNERVFREVLLPRTGRSVELFDVVADPGETVDRSGDEPERAAAMLDALLRHEGRR